MKYPYILFDLDGTLTDPGIGITNAVMHALRKFGITIGDRTELYKFIGPPLWESFEKYYGFSAEEAKTAVAYYREYYKPIGLYENLVYDGIEALLKTLQGSGRTLAVATSKPEVFSRQILDHFGLSPYFLTITGSELDGTRVNKAEVIACALERCGVKSPSQALMIGDREHDIIGAKKAGAASIGVLYGYGCRDELERAGADYIAESVNAIEKILLGADN